MSDLDAYFPFQGSGCITTVMKTSVILILLVWTSCNPSVTGEPQFMGSSQAVLAKAGDDVTLPCHIKPPVDASKMPVRWSRPDLKPEYVHVLSEGREVFYSKNPLYKRRTSLFHEELPHGNISLKLFRVQLSDEGKYKCFIPSLHSSSEIQLLVGAVSQPVISLIGIKGGLLSWSCDSGCWYPQPEMSWLDGEGNNITAESSVAVRRSQHCYTVQTSVTVWGEERVTCRVHQPHINYTNTVETRSVIPGAVSQPMISQIGPKENDLSCDSGCWYPEPEMSWLDSEGNILPVDSSVLVRGPNHCYIVRTNVTVRRAGRVTCRVHQPLINHSVETHRVIPEGSIPEARGRYGVKLVLPCMLVVLLIVMICCYLKLKQIAPTTLQDRFGPALQKIKQSLLWCPTRPKQKKCEEKTNQDVIMTEDSACNAVVTSGDLDGGVTSEQQDKSSKQLNMVTTTATVLHSDADSGYGGTSQEPE